MSNDWPSWPQAIGASDRIATVAVDLTDDDAPARIVETAVERGVASTS